MKKRRIALLLVALLIAVYFAGPSPAKPDFNTTLPELPQMATALETYVESREQKHRIKPGNHARIIWADAAQRQKTPVAVVYLHGFSASEREGFPIHQQFATEYGCNLYLARLSDHGIDTTDALYGMTTTRLWNSAKEAYAIGKSLGDEVIVMSTSTGGTLAVQLAAHYPDIKALINFSPNLAINDPNAWLLNKPWGLQIARIVFNGNTRTIPSDEQYRKYWYDTYRLEAITELQELVSSTAKESVYKKVKVPVWSGFYYKDENQQDPTVKVSAIKEMHAQLGTAAHLQQAVAFPEARTHVIPCDLMSQSIPEVYAAVSEFATGVLGMEKVALPQDTPIAIIE